MSASATIPAGLETKIRIDHLDAFYGSFQALKQVTFDIPARRITSMIGPSGCGKSTLLRCFNRMNDRVKGFRVGGGQILLDGRDLYERGTDLSRLRKRVGMVFQRPNPFPLSVYENVAYGPRIHGLASGGDLDAIVQQSLASVGLWDELKDRLDRNALELSGEQQQRMCIARVAAVEPDVLLMDEPCSALDPISTRVVEETIGELAPDITIVIVTHNMQQAQRVSQRCAFFLVEELGQPGRIVESGETKKMFESPDDPRTLDYVMGRFG